MRFRIFINHAVDGPYEASELRSLTHFSPTLMVCADGEDDWRPASSFPVLFPPLNQAQVEVQGPAKPRHWRQAVISGDIPEMRYRSWQPPAPSKPVPLPAAHRTVSIITGSWLAKGLLLLLWSIAVGLYYHQTDALAAIYEGIVSPVDLFPLR